jgi:hypothetical protein
MVRSKQEYWQGNRGEFTEDQDGKQDREGWDGKIGLHGAGERVQSLPVLFAACAGGAFRGQPGTCHSLGIIEPLLTLDGAGPLFRMDPMSCSAPFCDGAGCDRSGGDR